MLKKTKLTLAVLASVFCSTQAVAAWTPDKPVEFVVTAGAGGGTDTFARTIQSIIVKNKLMNVQKSLQKIKEYLIKLIKKITNL